MSAVDDVDARLCRLEESLQLTQTQLLELSTQRQYNPTLGVDEDRAGRSVATLEVSVIAARNLAFQSGFLAGRGTYVRATLDPPGAALDAPHKCTQKQPLSGAPCWQETLVFQGMAQLHSRLVVEVLQEERLGADRVVGALALDVSSLHDQRPTEKWLPLATHANAPTHGQLYLSCRLNRSLIFALELESELLQNQIRELRAFVERQRPAANGSYVARSISGRSLDGNQVASLQRTPPRRLHVDARLEAMHSPVVAVRKRERRQSSSAQASLASPVTELQQPRIKRRKLEPVTETHVESLSARLANWLLPDGANSSSAPVTLAGSPIKRRAASKKKKKSSALAALESWLFQDASGAVERVHAQMRAER